MLKSRLGFGVMSWLMFVGVATAVAADAAFTPTTNNVEGVMPYSQTATFVLRAPTMFDEELLEDVPVPVSNIAFHVSVSSMPEDYSGGEAAALEYITVTSGSLNLFPGNDTLSFNGEATKTVTVTLTIPNLVLPPVADDAPKPQFTYQITTSGMPGDPSCSLNAKLTIPPPDTNGVPPVVVFNRPPTPADQHIFTYQSGQTQDPITVEFTATAAATHPVQSIDAIMTGVSPTGATISGLPPLDVSWSNIPMAQVTGTAIVPVPLPPGTYTILARGSNSTGLGTAVTTFSIEVASAQPTIEITAPVDGAAYNYDVITGLAAHLDVAFTANAGTGATLKSWSATLTRPNGSSIPLSIAPLLPSGGSASGGIPLDLTVGGQYSLSVSATNNFNVTVTDTVTFTVNVIKALPTISWLDPEAIVYGTAISGTQLNAVATVNGNPVAGTFAYSVNPGAILGAGTYTLSVVFTPNNTTDFEVATAEVDLTVLKKELTVTANDKSRLVGVANPLFDVTYSGFIPGDNAANSLIGEPVLSTVADLLSIAGLYPITVAQGTLASDNYSFKFVDGVLTLLDVPLNHTISGVVFFDLNANGVQDADEIGLGGFPVKLYLPIGLLPLASTTTAADGSYSFTVLPGAYLVKVSSLSGFSATTATSHSVTALAGVTAPATGFRLNFDALRRMCADAHSHGFWKTNIKKALEGKTHGVQVPAATLESYTATLATLALDPFADLTLSSAYATLAGSNQLPMQLLAAEYNFVSGAFISGSETLTYAFIYWGEHVLKNSALYGSSYRNFAAEWFEAYNTADGCGINGPCDTPVSRPKISLTEPDNCDVFTYAPGLPGVDISFSFVSTSSSGFLVDAVSATLDGQPVAGISTTGLGTNRATSSGTLVGVTAGTHTLKVTALSGGVSVRDSVTFTVKKVGRPPVVNIATPANYQTFTYNAGDTPPVIAFTFAADSTSGPVETLSAKLNHSGLSFEVTGLGTAHATGTVADLGVTAAGFYKLTVTATNDYGSTAETSYFKVVVHKPDVSVCITDPEDCEEFKHTIGTPALDIPFAFKVTTSSGFQVDSVSAWLDGSPVAISNLAGVGSSNVATGSGTLQSVSAGQHVLKVVGVSAGVSEFATVLFTVKDVPGVPQPSAATAIIRKAIKLNGGVDGSLHILEADDMTLNGSAWISGDLFVRGKPTVKLNGHPTYGGTIDGNGSASPSDYKVTLNGNAVLRHVVRRTNPVAMPDVSAPPSPNGNRNVTLNSSSQSAGNFATVRNLTLNGNAGYVIVPPGTYGQFTANGNSGFILGVAGSTTPAVYNFQKLTLNGSSKLKIVGPVVLTLDDDVTVNGTSMGNDDHPQWLTLRIHDGDLTLNGGVSFYGNVLAPDGEVTINGNSTLRGSLSCDELTINGNGLLDLVP